MLEKEKDLESLIDRLILLHIFNKNYNKDKYIDSRYNFSQDLNKAWEVFNKAMSKWHFSERKKFYDVLRKIVSTNPELEGSNIAHLNVLNHLGNKPAEAICLAVLITELG